MRRRTTIEIDPELLERARRALHARSAREAVETALRQAAEAVEIETQLRAERQRAYLDDLAAHVDMDVLLSDAAWR